MYNACQYLRLFLHLRKPALPKMHLLASPRLPARHSVCLSNRPYVPNNLENHILRILMFCESCYNTSTLPVCTAISDTLHEDLLASLHAYRGQQKLQREMKQSFYPKYLFFNLMFF